jgi:hypothetical protein
MKPSGWRSLRSSSNQMEVPEMTVSERVGAHLRQNVIGYVAVFIACTGTSYAAGKVTTNQIKRDAITSPLIKNGQVKSADVANENIRGVDVAPNSLSGSDIDEGSLRGLNTSLADGSVTTEKLADGSVTLPKLGFDPATQAEVDGLLANVALLDGAQSFTGTNAFGGTTNLNGPAILNGLVQLNADLDATFGNGESLSIQATQTGTDATTPLVSNITNNTSSGLQRAASFSNLAGTGSTDFLLSLANVDSDTPVGTGIDFGGLGAIGTGIDFGSMGGMTTAIDASDGGVGTALAIGSNDITTSGATISSTELERLDGAATRSVSLPLNSFVNVTANQTLDFTSGADSSPDFGAVSDRPYIEWDDTGGSADVDQVATSFTVPQDFASNGTIRLIYREFGTVGVSERIVCDASTNDTAFGAADTVSAGGVPALIGANIDPVVTYTPGATIVLRCNADDGLGGTTANDPVRLHSATFNYTAAK